MAGDPDSKVASSKRIAGLIGPVLIAVAMSEWINLRAFAANPLPVVYLNGTLLLVAGIAIVRDHNRWVRGWPLLVTLTGWASTVLGLFRMFAPSSAAVADYSVPVHAMFAAILSVGIVLTIKGYARRSTASR
jgi:hypothetical protein